MRHCLRVALIILLPACAAAQETSFAVPDRVKVDNVPPIPLSIVDGVAPYAQFRQARLLGWHPTARQILISTAFGNVTQIHEVRSPGGARTQLTFYSDGVTGGASYDPAGRYILFRKDTSGGGEAMQLFRYELGSGRITMLTDGKSRNGTPVWSHNRGLVAYASTRRNGKDRDLWVMNPLEPENERMVAEVEGTWDALDWSADDKEILALELIPGSTETRLWRIDADSKRRTLVTPKDGPPSRWTAATFGDGGRAVFALSDRESDLTRVWRCDLASGRWTPGHQGRPRHRRLCPISRWQSARRCRRSRRDERAAVCRYADAPAPHRSIDSAGSHLAGRLASCRRRCRHRVRWRAHVSRRLLGIGKDAGARALDDERDGWRGPGCAARRRDRPVEELRWPMIPGILYRPAKRFTGPRPVMINVHGGPETRERPRGLGRSNYFRNELGMAIIYPNIRGSSGYGKSLRAPRRWTEP